MQKFTDNKLYFGYFTVKLSSYELYMVSVNIIVKLQEFNSKVF